MKSSQLADLVIYPTESSYALGCRYNDKAAIRRIMQLKGRRDDRFTVIASSLQQVQKHFKLSAEQLQLAKQYWPGALSIVVSPKYAIRVPVTAAARKLAQEMGTPILATSLNISGEPAIYDLRHLVETRLIASLRANVNIIDDGPLPKNSPSTVIECFRGGYVIHRQGAVTLV